MYYKGDDSKAYWMNNMPAKMPKYWLFNAQLNKLMASVTAATQDPGLPTNELNSDFKQIEQTLQDV